MTKLPGCRPVFEPDDFQPIRKIISGKFSFHIILLEITLQSGLS